MSHDKLYFPGELKFSFVSIKNNYNYNRKYYKCVLLLLYKHNQIDLRSLILFFLLFFIFHPLVSVNFVVAPSGDNHPANKLHN